MWWRGREEGKVELSGCSSMSSSMYELLRLGAEPWSLDARGWKRPELTFLRDVGKFKDWR
jgi:hypothetical protein